MWNPVKTNKELKEKMEWKKAGRRRNVGGNMIDGKKHEHSTQLYRMFNNKNVL